jgi:hypothetical protein
VWPGLVDTIMCGCGGNVYDVAVTSKRIIEGKDPGLNNQQVTEGWKVQGDVEEATVDTCHI